MPSTTTSSEQPPSSVPREPKSSSSQVEASRGSNSQNSDDEDEDEDEDDDWLTRPRPHLRFSPEVGHDHDHDHREPSRDGPSAAAASSSSSSAPKVVDNGAVPAEVAAAVLPVPFRLSLVLRNTGSVARDHLASERTFLAYVRTSLSFASAGVGPSFRPPRPPLFFLIETMCVHITCSSGTAVSRLGECEREWFSCVACDRFLCEAVGRDAGWVWNGGVVSG